MFIFLLFFLGNDSCNVQKAKENNVNNDEGDDSENDDEMNNPQKLKSDESRLAARFAVRQKVGFLFFSFFIS